MKFTDGDVKRPLVLSHRSETVGREIDTLADADSGSTREQERIAGAAARLQRFAPRALRSGLASALAQPAGDAALLYKRIPLLETITAAILWLQAQFVATRCPLGSVIPPRADPGKSAFPPPQGVQHIQPDRYCFFLAGFTISRLPAGQSALA